MPENIHRYIEPFAGSACLFFDIAPAKALISDLNADLMQTYAAVRDRPDTVAVSLQKLPVSRTDYYRIRSLDPTDLSPFDRAARFIYLNRFCFNGLYRTNRAGKFNVPFGKPKTHSIPTRNDLRSCAALLKRATLKTGDFETVIKSHLRPTDFVYLDPPFFQKSRRMFRQYTPEPFLENDLDRLQALLRFIDCRGATFVVSYASCSEAKAAFADWRHHRIRTHRNISGFADSRRRFEELVVTNLPA